MRYTAVFYTSNRILCKDFECESPDDVIPIINDLLHASDTDFIECNNNRYLRFSAVESFKIEEVV